MFYLIGSRFNRFYRSSLGDEDWVIRDKRVMPRKILSHGHQRVSACSMLPIWLILAGFFHLHGVSGSTWCSEQNLSCPAVCLCRTRWILAVLYWCISQGADGYVRIGFAFGSSPPLGSWACTGPCDVSKLCKEGWRRHLETCRRSFSEIFF